MNTTENLYDNIADCILYDVLIGVCAVRSDIDHSAMLTMINALEGMEGDAKNKQNAARYSMACTIVNHVMTDEYSQAVKLLKEYWK